jgi:glycosyltransferase involved in cell wall biosynthesis
MRVLHVISTLGVGGAERQLTYLAEGLHELGCTVHVAILAGGVNLKRVEASGATLHRLQARGNRDPLIPVKLFRLVRRLRPAVVQTWLPQMDVFGGAAALATRTPWILSERCSGSHYDRGARETLRRLVGRFADLVVANSESGLTAWQQSRGIVIRNAVRFDEIEEASADPTDYGSAKVVLFAGRMAAVKNVPTFLRAVREAMEQRDVIALVCGSGPFTDEVRTLSADPKNRIRLLGHCDNLPSLLKRADMLVAPSWHEGNPNVVLEAAAARCPLILSDIAAHRALFDEQSARFAPPDDARAFAAAIVETIDDPARARARAERAHEIVRPWTVDRAARAYLDVYQQLLRSDE